MNPREILQTAIAFCFDASASPRTPGRIALMAARTKRELEDLLFHLQLNHEALLKKELIPRSPRSASEQSSVERNR
jgi:hypothetical protein